MLPRFGEGGRGRRRCGGGGRADAGGLLAAWFGGEDGRCWGVGVGGEAGHGWNCGGLVRIERSEVGGWRLEVEAMTELSWWVGVSALVGWPRGWWDCGGTNTD